MKVIYVHHAERDRENKSVSRQEQDITENGVREAEQLASKMKDLRVTKIYSSPYKRCIHTAEILNRDLGLDIQKEARFNEYESFETFEEFLKRNISAIQDIVMNSCEDDVVLCITSGVNLSAFVCYFTGNAPSNDSLRCQGITISPVLFSTDTHVF